MFAAIGFIFNLLIGLSGVLTLFVSIYLIIFQKNKRNDDWKIIIPCLIWGVIICLVIINLIFD